jgi:hypothetical protein
MIKLLFAAAAAGAGYLLGTIGAKRAISEQIDAKIADLETKLRPQAAPAPAPQPAPAPAPAKVERAPAPAAAIAPKEEEIPLEVLAVISAAVCTFLGKPAKIKRVRRTPGSGLNPWAQVGRVSVMASHALGRK